MDIPMHSLASRGGFQIRTRKEFVLDESGCLPNICLASVRIEIRHYCDYWSLSTRAVIEGARCWFLHPEIFDFVLIDVIMEIGLRQIVQERTFVAISLCKSSTEAFADSDVGVERFGAVVWMLVSPIVPADPRQKPIPESLDELVVFHVACSLVCPFLRNDGGKE